MHKEYLRGDSCISIHLNVNEEPMISRIVNTNPVPNRIDGGVGNLSFDINTHLHYGSKDICKASPLDAQGG